MSDDFRRVAARGAKEPPPVLLTLGDGLEEHFDDARPTDAASLVEWMDFRDGYLNKELGRPNRPRPMGVPLGVQALQAAGILAVAAVAMAAVVAAFLCYA